MYDVGIFSSYVLTDEEIEEFLQMVKTSTPDTDFWETTNSHDEPEDRRYTVKRSGHTNFLIIVRDPDDYLLHAENVILELGYRPHMSITISFHIDNEHIADQLMRDIVGLFASRWPCTFDNDGVGEQKRIFHREEILRRWKNGEAYY